MMRSSIEQLFQPREIGLGKDHLGNLEKLEVTPMTGETRLRRFSPEGVLLGELRGRRGTSQQNLPVER